MQAFGTDSLITESVFESGARCGLCSVSGVPLALSEVAAYRGKLPPTLNHSTSFSLPEPLAIVLMARNHSKTGDS